VKKVVVACFKVLFRNLLREKEEKFENRYLSQFSSRESNSAFPEGILFLTAVSEYKIYMRMMI
jgi:hypothetical protein